jgi:hypothetical protein
MSKLPSATDRFRDQPTHLRQGRPHWYVLSDKMAGQNGLKELEVYSVPVDEVEEWLVGQTFIGRTTGTIPQFRKKPPAWWKPRDAVEKCENGDWIFPDGTTVHPETG